MKRFDAVCQWTWNLWSRFHGDVTNVGCWDGFVIIPASLKLEYFLIPAGWDDKIRWGRPRLTPFDQLECCALTTLPYFVIPSFQQCSRGKSLSFLWDTGLMHMSHFLHPHLSTHPSWITHQWLSVRLLLPTKGLLLARFEGLRKQGILHTVKLFTTPATQCFLSGAF